ncbi:DUF4124 domain-containing protein [Marilutibacter alkalisoli]|uniref:DUF4124 domain-containing protein n=1 Tax=Marilutibacter alkalisoli TaxID=2591633 RepID=A0A514BV84_9GAMM|nr:DUF4124 domain-containing protein [Lysobacter alkalisoli]QDH71290.1 DUF4124 domain-containing protein [Lysobacter alkalisoli]
MPFHLPRAAAFLPFAALLIALAPPANSQTVLYRCTDAGGNLTVQNDPCPAGTQERKQVIGEVPSAPTEASQTPARGLPAPEWQLPSPADNPAASGMPASAPEIPILAPLPAPSPLMPVTAPDPAAIPLPAPGQPIMRQKPLEVIVDTRETEYRILDSGIPLAERDPDDADAATTDEQPPPPALQACRGWDNEIRYSEAEEPQTRCKPLQTTGLGGLPGLGAGTACEMIADRCTAVPEDQLCDAWLRRLRDEQAQLVFARSEDPAATRAEIERIESVLRDSHCSAR